MTTKDVIASPEEMNARKVMYSFLAELFSQEVSADVLEKLRMVSGAEDTDFAVHGFEAETIQMGETEMTVLDALAVDFSSIFLAANNMQKAAFPYESVYTSSDRLLNQEAAREVRTLYLKHGFVPEMRYKVPADHISLEFSFMAMLCDEGLADEQQEFFNKHIAVWVFEFIKDGKGFAETEFYQSLFDLCLDFMNAEKELLA